MSAARLFIGGTWTDGARVADLEHKYTGEPLAEVHHASRDQVHAAVAALTATQLHVNETASSRVDLMPYGGVKDSGFGKEGPRHAVREMTEERLVTIAYD